ncbi:MAG TPA: LLM class flavin-dependent oxidoreductase [Solirubrobacterales bacterium]|jgi:alkanesulfonate monooxygenase SsuD/methylene tetrahydromethanopterin reductase-like flavin-dependent oxidoreductase (luciferase family)|nr:LLM class flavin-dependent oxidoreductase [Solirubrobacterales bacterium]
MEIGIGLPNAVPGVDRAGTVDFARRAQEAGFASLGTLDRIVFDNYESLIALAAAAAVTEKIRLVTDILISPLRSNTALLAKQAATLDSMSGGRLTLGLAPGGREDDFEVSGLDFSERGKVFERQLQELPKLWNGEGGVGPKPASERPTLLIGGYTEIAHRRAAKYADGWTMGGGTPEALKEGKAMVEAEWNAAGRDDSPWIMALCYFALGPDAGKHARDDLLAYYAWLGDEVAEQIAESAATDPDTVTAYISAFEQAGADELIMFATHTDPGQVELLAEAAL